MAVKDLILLKPILSLVNSIANSIFILIFKNEQEKRKHEEKKLLIRHIAYTIWILAILSTLIFVCYIFLK